MIQMEGLRERKPSLKPVNTRRAAPQENGNCVIVDGVTGEEVPEPLSPWSKSFHEPDFNIHILAIMGTKTPIDASNVKELATELMMKHPRFTSTLVGDPSKGEELKWVRVKQIDLDYHIIVPPIDPDIIPGSKMADKYVEDYIYNLSKTSLDKSRPLWDIHILKLKTTSDEEGFGIIRLHHSLGDGISLMSFLLSCTRKVSDPTALPTIPVSKKKEWIEFGSDSGVYSYCWKVLMLLWWVFMLLCNTCVDVLMFFATSLFLKDTDTPIRRRPDSSLRPRRVLYRTVSLEDIKLIKNKMNATINDVALGITQAGLSVYLDRKYNDGYETKDDASTRQKKKNKLPNNIRLRSLVLVNIRPSPGIQEFSKMMEKNSKAKWGNWVGYLLLPFTIRLQDNPLDYVREAKITVDRKKHSLEAIFSFLSVKILPKLFGDKVANYMSKRHSTVTTISFSNVVGPVEEILLCGHEIKFLTATVYGQPQPLTIHFTSYVNQMTLVVSVDEDNICDPEQLCDDIVESLRLIKEACNGHS